MSNLSFFALTRPFYSHTWLGQWNTHLICLNRNNTHVLEYNCYEKCTIEAHNISKVEKALATVFLCYIYLNAVMQLPATFSNKMSVWGYFCMRKELQFFIGSYRLDGYSTVPIIIAAKVNKLLITIKKNTNCDWGSDL